jgi:hypothetical protein
VSGCLNATCKFTEPQRSVSDDDTQQREHELHDHRTEYRCSVWDMSAHGSLTVTGRVGVQALELQIRCPGLTPAPGWIVDVKRNGDEDFAEYRVITAQRGSRLLPTRLTLEGVS